MRTPELLIQVDLAGEATKFGIAPAEVPTSVGAPPPVPGRTRRRADDSSAGAGSSRGRAALVPSAA